jgi:hypothetical protein
MAGGFEQPAQRIPKRVVVIDDKNGAVSLAAHAAAGMEK